ncbi:hypothetical protein Scep_029821 [Stephania cephalantha]|uniref:Uncharacterized protein n=1 Tax=Stephania cephalantha TaxID=152367 RepID=A0AAP0DYE3_9MAGN
MGNSRQGLAPTSFSFYTATNSNLHVIAATRGMESFPIKRMSTQVKEIVSIQVIASTREMKSFPTVCDLIYELFDLLHSFDHSPYNLGSKERDREVEGESEGETLEGDLRKGRVGRGRDSEVEGESEGETTEGRLGKGRLGRGRDIVR